MPRSSRSASDLPLLASNVQLVHRTPEYTAVVKIQAVYRGTVVRRAQMARHAHHAPAQMRNVDTVKTRTEARLDRMLEDLGGDPTFSGRQFAQLHHGPRTHSAPTR